MFYLLIINSSHNQREVYVHSKSPSSLQSLQDIEDCGVVPSAHSYQEIDLSHQVLVKLPVLTVPYGVYTFVRLLATANFHIRKATFLLSIIIANINLPFNLSTTGCV